MNPTNRTLRWLLLACLLSPAAYGQSKVNFAELQQKYPNDELIMLQESERIVISTPANQLRIEAEHQEELLFMNEKASRYADHRIRYSDFFQEISDLEATTYLPEGNRYKKVPVKEIKTEKPSSRGIFYDDVLVKRFDFEGVKKGAIGTVRYKEVIKDPHTLSSFMFGRYIPVLNGEFSVTFPSSVKLSYKTYGDMKGVNFQTTQSRGSTTYSWKTKNVSSFPYESNAPNLRYFAPQVFLFIEEYTLNGKTQPVLSDERKLFNYYVSLVKNVDRAADAPLNALVDSLTHGKPETEKIRSIYYWVQDNIRYLAFEDGLGGFVPRSPSSVFHKRYGDCKDMATLLNCMLKRAGIPSHTVWIGTREIPFKYQENPSLGVDNHMIAAVQRDGKWIFLDATADKIDYGLPTPHIQGKQALVMLSEQDFTIAEVPVVEDAKNTRTDKMDLHLRNDEIEGKGVCTYDGLWKMDVKYKLADLSEVQRETYYQSLFSRGNNKCKVEHVQASNLKARDEALRFSYSFKVPDYVRAIGGERFVNLHLSRPLQNAQIEATRKLPVEYDFRNLNEQTTVLHLPTGTKVVSLPEGKSYNHERFGFQITYAREAGKVIVRNRIYIKCLLIQPADFAAWNEMVSLLNDAYNESISLQ
jgi:transglutaminase-like putative cysteine protease